jgi:hypothetical protein
LTFCLRLFVVSTFFNNVNDIEIFVRKIQLNVQSIIQEAIFMIKKSKHAQFFWNFKCLKIVTTIKTKRRKWSSRRIEKNWKTYLKFIDVKKKIIVKKKIKIQKNLWKVYNLNNVTLTFYSLSEIAESQIEKNLQNFEFDSKKQFKKNNTNCQKLREQNEHDHETIFFKNKWNKS